MNHTGLISQTQEAPLKFRDTYLIPGGCISRGGSPIKGRFPYQGEVPLSGEVPLGIKGSVRAATVTAILM